MSPPSIKRPLNSHMWAAIGKISGTLHVYGCAEAAKMAAESEPFPVTVVELGKKSQEFLRGYYCAVAVSLRESGLDTLTRSLFTQGGSTEDILAACDADDIELFKEYDLLK